MSTKKFIVFAGILAGLLGILLYAFPTTRYIVQDGIAILGSVLEWTVWSVIIPAFVLAVVFGFGPILGFVAKSYGAATVDAFVEPGNELTSWMHGFIALIGGIAVGIVQSTWLMDPLMGLETWVRWVAMFAGWDGAYETAPPFWFFYAVVLFAIAYWYSKYQVTPHSIALYREKRAANKLPRSDADKGM